MRIGQENHGGHRPPLQSKRLLQRFREELFLFRRRFGGGFIFARETARTFALADVTARAIQVAVIAVVDVAHHAFDDDAVRSVGYHIHRVTIPDQLLDLFLEIANLPPDVVGRFDAGFVLHFGHATKRGGPGVFLPRGLD